MIGAACAFSACATVQSSRQVVVSPATLALIKAQPEFADVECVDGARLAVLGAEVASGALLLSVNCVAF